MQNNEIKLPKYKITGKKSLEELLYARKSEREYNSNYKLKITELSQILWAAYGENKNNKTVPSAGGIYPTNIYVLTESVDKLPDAVYQYKPKPNALIKKIWVKEGSIKEIINKQCFVQEFMTNANLLFIITADVRIIAKKYPRRFQMYLFLEAGHICQNIYLQCNSLNLGCTEVGAFINPNIKKILQLPKTEMPLITVVVGKRRK